MCKDGSRFLCMFTNRIKKKGLQEQPFQIVKKLHWRGSAQGSL